MAAENRSEGFRTPVKERFETFNVCFGGALGVGKTTLFEYLKSGSFVERSFDEARETGVDVTRLEREVDGTDIKVRSRRHTRDSQVSSAFLVRAVLSSCVQAVQYVFSVAPRQAGACHNVRLRVSGSSISSLESRAIIIVNF